MVFEEICLPLQPKIVMKKVESGMKKALLACCVVLSTTILMPSCLGDDDDVTLYDDVAITAVTLGTLNSYLTTTASDGSDSVYKHSYGGSTFKIAIDQLGHRIWNVDPLPLGTDLKHVVCTVTAKNNGVVALLSLDSDSLKVVTTTDSIDFSIPRTLRVVSSDAKHWRDYVMTLTARQQAAGELTWTAADAALMPAEPVVDSIDVTRIDADASLVPQLALTGVTWQGRGNVEYTLWAGLTAETDTAMTLWRRLRDADHEGNWVLMTQTEDNPYYLPAAQMVLVYTNSNLLALCSDGTVYYSENQGITWKTDEKLTMPADFGGAPMRAVTDSEGYLWLQDATGRVWRGEISK